MKKPFKFAALGLGALALFATTYFTIFAVMGVPLAKTPVAESVFGEETAPLPTQPVVSKPADSPARSRARRAGQAKSRQQKINKHHLSFGIEMILDIKL